jgi:hypothetical protein
MSLQKELLWPTKIVHECCAGGTGLETFVKEMRRRRGLTSNAGSQIADNSMVRLTDIAEKYLSLTVFPLGERTCFCIRACIGE